MLNTALIKKKISLIGTYLSEIEPALQQATAEIVSNTLLLRGIERNFQLIVDAMIDINTHIIAANRLKSPLGAQETFSVLAETGILSNDLVERIAPVVGLRNKAVHEYEGITPGKFIEDLRKEKDQFKEYSVFIDSYIQSQKNA